MPFLAHNQVIDRQKKLRARFFETASGRRPVREWLLSLAEEDRRVVGKDIQKVEFGWPIGMPYCRPFGDGLWEVRTDLAHGRIARVIFSIANGEMDGFEKKAQKTAPQDLALARRRMKEISE